MRTQQRWLDYLLWSLFGVWLLLFIGTFIALAQIGELPADFASYQIAADQITTSATIYPATEVSQTRWQEMHQSVIDAYAVTPFDSSAAEPIPTPYVYPPTLALLMAQIGLNAVVFGVLIVLATVSFVWLLWQDISVKSAWYLLFIIFSWDIIASISGANIEIILLFLSLLAAWLIWQNHGVLAAFPIAFVFLVKPFYGVFFAGFALLLLAQQKFRWDERFKTILWAAGGSFVLIGLEVLRWPTDLRTASLTYFQEGLAHQWFVLPLEQQMPMNLWNRSYLQVMVNFGIEPTLSQTISIGIWLLFLIVSLFAIAGKRHDFATTYALAFILLILGRPVSWTLPFLEFVLLIVLIPVARTTWAKRGIIAALALYTLSHWIALGRATAGFNANLFTLQTPSFPWEMLIVLPACWLALLWIVRHPTNTPSANQLTKSPST